MSFVNPNATLNAQEVQTLGTIRLIVISMHVGNYMVGLPLNIYVITVLFFNGCSKLDPCEIFTFNQAVAEIFFMFFGPFHILLYVTSGTWFYKPLGFFLGTGMGVRAGFQCFVCLEHYVAVVHPIMYLKVRLFRYRMVMCATVWIHSLVAGFICMITFPDMPYLFFGVIFFLILIITSFCCLAILRKLRHPGPGERNPDKGMEDGAKTRAFRVVRRNLLTFVVQNTPLAILFGTLYTLPWLVFKLATDICLVINLVMGFVQPVFMLHKAGKLF